jgi:hypothetical protein
MLLLNPNPFQSNYTSCLHPSRTYILRMRSRTNGMRQGNGIIVSMDLYIPQHTTQPHLLDNRIWRTPRASNSTTNMTLHTNKLPRLSLFFSFSVTYSALSQGIRSDYFSAFRLLPLPVCLFHFLSGRRKRIARCFSLFYPPAS